MTPGEELYIVNALRQIACRGEHLTGRESHYEGQTVINEATTTTTGNTNTVTQKVAELAEL